MKIPNLSVVQENGPVTVNAKFVNLDLSGLSNAKVYKVSGFNENSNTVEIRFKTPKATCASPYKISGRILVFPVSGEGDSKLIFGELDCVESENNQK